MPIDSACGNSNFDLKCGYHLPSHHREVNRLEVSNALQLYSQRYLGGLESKLRITFAVTYYNGDIDEAHRFYLESITRKNPHRFTGTN